ncbi:hypothetical protein CEXT_85831, partial [Caerostris extrusa]
LKAFSSSIGTDTRVNGSEYYDAP